MRQAKRFAIALRCMAVKRKVPFEHFVGFAVDHADQTIRLNRGPDGDEAFRLFRFNRLRGYACALQRSEDILYQRREASGVHIIMADMRTDDVRGQSD